MIQFDERAYFSNGLVQAPTSGVRIPFSIRHDLENRDYSPLTN